jgi:HEAT repeat protein
LCTEALTLYAEMLPRENEPKIRMSIAVGISATRLPASVPLLIAMADDPEPAVAGSAIDRLGIVGSSTPALTDAILPFLVDRLAVELSDPDVSRGDGVDPVIRALGYLNDRRALDAIETAVRRERYGFKLPAIRALGEMAARNRRGPTGRSLPTDLRQYAISRADRDRAEGLLREALTQAHEAYAHRVQEALDSLVRGDEEAAERARRTAEIRARNAALLK